MESYKFVPCRDLVALVAPTHTLEKSPNAVQLCAVEPQIFIIFEHFIRVIDPHGFTSLFPIGILWAKRSQTNIPRAKYTNKQQNKQLRRLKKCPSFSIEGERLPHTEGITCNAYEEIAM